MSKLFYRIGDKEQGLWYHPNGEFTGMVHQVFNWCRASILEMPFDEQLVGYLSVADSLEHLYQWFSKEELIKLQTFGFQIYEYAATDYKFYDRYQHNVINQKTSVINNIILLK